MKILISISSFRTSPAIGVNPMGEAYISGRQSPLQNIIFDLDGVLIDPEPLKMLSYITTLASYGFPLGILEREGFVARCEMECIGKSRQGHIEGQMRIIDEIMQRLSEGERGWVPERIRAGLTGFLEECHPQREQFATVWETYAADRLEIYEGMKRFVLPLTENLPFLDYVVEQGITPFLVTRTEEDTARAHLREKVGREDVFRYACVPDKKTLKYGPVTEILQDEGQALENCAVVEDTAEGVLEARRQGSYYIIAAPRPSTRSQDFSAADRMVMPSLGPLIPND